MKILLPLFAFAVALSFTSASQAAGGGHGDLSEKMNALFPQPQAEAKKSVVPTKPELVAPSY
ncbi:MAG: fibronectin type III domain-containing protein, partial [Bdellovibrio sp.]